MVMDMEIVFQNDWMKIIKNLDVYIIQYNSGDLTNSVKEVVVSRQEAEIAQESEQSAYDLILKYQNLENKQHRNTNE